MKKCVFGFVMMAAATLVNAQAWEGHTRTVDIYEGGSAVRVDNSHLYASATPPVPTAQVQPRTVHVYNGGRATVVDNTQGWVALAQPDSSSPDVQPVRESAQSGMTLKQVVIGAAFADAITTKIMLKSGGYERNPLIKPTTSGLLTAAAVNWAIVEMVDRSNLEPATKKSIMQAGSAMWTGAAVNNLAIALSAANPVAIAAGVAAGVYMWNRH